MKRRIPNILTGIRLPLCILGLVLEAAGFAVFGLILLMACFLTDFADGKLARGWKVVSRWGEKWDPVIDAITIVLIYSYLMIFENLPYALKIMFLLIAFRNVFLSQGFKYLHKTALASKEPWIIERVTTINHVSRAGKWSTALQMAAITGFFVFKVGFQDVQATFFIPLFILAFIFSAYSGYKYVRDGWKLATLLWHKRLFPIQEKLSPFVGVASWLLAFARRLARALPL